MCLQAKGCQRLPANSQKLGDRPGQILPLSPQKELTLPASWSYSCSFQKHEMITACCLNLPAWVLASEQTNTPALTPAHRQGLSEALLQASGPGPFCWSQPWFPHPAVPPNSPSVRPPLPRSLPLKVLRRRCQSSCC